MRQALRALRESFAAARASGAAPPLEAQPRAD
jgi:hypothetical protein